MVQIEIQHSLIIANMMNHPFANNYLQNQNEAKVDEGDSYVHSDKNRSIIFKSFNHGIIDLNKNLLHMAVVLCSYNFCLPFFLFMSRISLEYMNAAILMSLNMHMMQLMHSRHTSLGG